jgi:hypothetical protein
MPLEDTKINKPESQPVYGFVKDKQGKEYRYERNPELGKERKKTYEEYLELRRLLAMGIRNIGYALYNGKIYGNIGVSKLFTAGEYMGKTKIVISQDALEKVEPDENFDEIFSVAPIFFKLGVVEMMIMKGKITLDVDYKDVTSDEVARSVKSIGMFLRKFSYDSINEIVRDRVHNDWKFNKKVEKYLKDPFIVKYVNQQHKKYLAYSND